MARLAGNPLDLPIGGDEQGSGQFYAPSGYEMAHPLAHLLNEQVAQVMGVDLQRMGDDVDSKLWVREVLLDVLKSSANLRMTGVPIQRVTVAVRRGLVGFDSSPLTARQPAKEIDMANHEALDEDVQEFHVTFELLLRH